MVINKNIAFNPIDTFECGQCFRWNLKDGVYTGVSGGRVCKVKNRDFEFSPSDEEYWNKYFAFNVDYADIQKRLLKADNTLKPCIDFGSGIRILKQDIWETIVSFIISANNNIPRIKKIIETLCHMYGEEIVFDGDIYYAFPSPKRLALLLQEDLAPLRAGYRDKYILDAAAKVASGEVDINSLYSMSDEDARKTLMKIKGVGRKVADCILLFSLGRFSVFPADVWIKRILNNIYNIENDKIIDFVTQKYGALAGYAQQYLYYYYRSNEAAQINGD